MMQGKTIIVWFSCGAASAVALQDNSSTFPNFGPFPIAGGEWVGFRSKWDKAADITAGFFGYLENA